MTKKQTYLEGLGADLSSREFFQPNGKKKLVRIQSVELANETKELPGDKGLITVIARVVLDEYRVGIWMENLQWEISSKRALQALNPVLDGPGCHLTVRKTGSGTETMYVAEKADAPEA